MKNLVSSKGKKLKNNPGGNCGQYRPGFKLQISKKLNSAGYLFILASYTAGVVLLTLYYSGSGGGESSQARLNFDLKRQIVGDLKKELSFQKEREPIHATELAKLKESILKEVNDLHLKYFDIITQHEEKRRPKILLRDPASANKKMVEGQALSYNSKNREILREKQNIEIKRRKEVLAAKKEAFFKTLNLSKAEDQLKWRTFQDQQKLELSALKAEHNQQWRNFRTEKFIVVQNF